MSKAKTMRKIIFQNDNFYHIYNRGVDKREIFLAREDYVRFLVSMREFNQVDPVGSLFVLDNLRKAEKTLDVYDCRRPTSKLVDFIAYCLIPNHYHFILRQVVDGGISEFMKRIGGGYTKYFNARYDRSGTLFQGRFKAVELNSTDKISELSMYINGNSEIHRLAKANKYPWSSYLDYLEERDGTLCNKDIVLANFSSLDEYKNLSDMIIKEIREERSELKKYILEK